MLQKKHKAFADYYIETSNAADSYRRAYPSCKTDGTARANASKLLTNPDITAYIDEQMSIKDEATIASANEVLEFLTAQMRSDNVASKERIKAAELLGKRHRLFVERIEADISQTVIFEGEDDLEE